MADKVEISRRDIERVGDAAGSAAGKAAGKKVSREMKQVRNEIDTLNSRLKDVEDEINKTNQNIEELKRRVVEVEEKKAKAEKEAKKDIRNRLKQRFEEKQEAYKRKRDEVLKDYQQGIQRIKDRFVGAISERRSGLDQVDDEFGEIASTREELCESDHHAEQMNANYRERLSVVENSREEFAGAVEEFLEDRRATAQTVDSLKTPIPGIDDVVQVRVPLWVVGIERDGREEIQVSPVSLRGRPEGPPQPDRPYVPYLQSHPVHDYSSFVPEVESWVQQAEVLDQLKQNEGRFADPSFLARLDGISDRFVEALSRFELRGRDSTQQETGQRSQQTTQERHKQSEQAAEVGGRNR